jgi:hypothetical protein
MSLETFHQALHLTIEGNLKCNCQYKKKVVMCNKKKVLVALRMATKNGCQSPI